jgi:hypothetical protein
MATGLHLQLHRGPSRYVIKTATAEAWIDPADLASVQGDAVRAMAMFLAGRAYGLPRIHGDIPAVMNADCVANEIQPEDLRLCREAEVCS